MRNYTYFEIRIVLVIFGLLLLAVPLHSQSVGVPLNSPVYNFVERLEARGIIVKVLNSTKPFSRIEVARYLSEARTAFDKGSEFSNVEDEQLTYFEQEFISELQQIRSNFSTKEITHQKWASYIIDKLPNAFYKNNKDLYRYKGDGFSIIVDPIFAQENEILDVDTLSESKKIFRFSTGFRLRGHVQDRLGFFIDARNTKEWDGSEDQQNINSALYGKGGVEGRLDYDETIAYIVYHTTGIDIEFGRNINRWGPGERGTLLLSGNTSSYDQLKLSFTSDRMKFQHIHAILNPMPRIIQDQVGTDERNIYAKRYIAASRLEFSLLPGLQLGLHEAIIYGQRGIEWGYLNPVIYLRSAEHYMGDQDNAISGMDFDLSRIKNWKFYGEIVVDDLKTGRLGSKWYGNKWGAQLGILWIDPVNITNSSLRVEYSKIKPFVYTHKYPINEFKHYQVGLGHQNGPNTDEWYLQFKKRFTRRFGTSLQLSKIRHGANPPGQNIGGDINLAHQEGVTDDYIGFLEGNVEKLTSFKLDGRYEAFRNLFIEGSLDYSKGDNFLIENVQGQSFRKLNMFIALRFNY